MVIRIFESVGLVGAQRNIIDIGRRVFVRVYPGTVGREKSGAVRGLAVKKEKKKYKLHSSKVANMYLSGRVFE